MDYKVLNLTSHPGRSVALFSIDKKGLRFNKLIARKMGIVRNAYITPYVNEDNLLCFEVSLTPDKKEALMLKKATNSQSLYISCSKIAKLFNIGAYQVVGNKDNKWITDCKLQSTN